MRDDDLIRNIRSRVNDESILRAMGLVPRSMFVPRAGRRFVNDDVPICIGQGQTTSQPSLIGIMIRSLSLKPTDSVLEIGSGSGYVCAILSHLCRNVVGVERIPEFVLNSRKVLSDLNIYNATLMTEGADIFRKDSGHFEAIIVSAALREVPNKLLGLLRPGGRIVCPVGTRDTQKLLKIERRAEGDLVTHIGDCRFVPFIGDWGWRNKSG